MILPRLPEREDIMMSIPVIDLCATGQRLTQLRLNAGLSVRDVQMIFGFSTPQAIYKWQRGAALPTIDNLVVLAAVFGVTLDELIVYRKAA